MNLRMARVSLAESEKIVAQGRGIKKFKAEIDKVHRFIFPVDETGMPFLYMNRVHTVNLGAVKGRAACTKGFSDFLNEAEGILRQDPTTGRPLNDGSCPYCELMALYNRVVEEKKDEFVAKNPDATDKQIKEFKAELYKSAPVKRAEDLRVFLVARILTDKTGMELTKVDNKPQFEVGFLTVSPTQYDNKFKPALVQLGGKLDFTDILFNYPPADSVMAAAKDLTIMPAIKQINTDYPTLRDDILKAIQELNPDTVEDKVYEFRRESVSSIRRKIAAVESRVGAELSEEQREQLKKDLQSSIGPNADNATVADIMSSIDNADEEDDNDTIDDSEATV